MSRRGFSLVEVMVTLVVGSVLASLVFLTVGQIQVGSRERSERAGLAATLRGVLAPLGRDLESVGADSLSGADLASLGSTSLTLRAHRGLWVVCRLALPDTIYLEASRPQWILRQPGPGRDSLLLYARGDSAHVADTWLPVPIIGGPSPDNCPSGQTAVRLVSRLDSAAVAGRGVVLPTVARTFETVGYRLYQSGGLWQFGLEEISALASIQPIAGPLAPGGLDLVGLARSGGITSVLPNVTSLAVTATAPASRSSAVGWGVARPSTDSLAVLLPLRNVP